jgi:hypothetical protein
LQAVQLFHFPPQIVPNRDHSRAPYGAALAGIFAPRCQSDRPAQPHALLHVPDSFSQYGRGGMCRKSLNFVAIEIYQCLSCGSACEAIEFSERAAYGRSLSK